MGTPGAGRKRLPNRERLTAEDDALNQIAREAEARLAAKRAARAEAREIRMKELERQQKEIYQVQKKYYGLDTKWGDIEQWMEDSERYSRRARRNASASDEDERMSVGSRGSLRTNGYEEDVYGSSQSRKSSRASYYSDLGLPNSSYASTSQLSSQNGNWPSLLYSDALPARSYRASVYDESVYSGSRRYSAPSSRAPSEYSCYLGSGSRASSRASSARASPVIEERPEKDFEKGARTVSSLSAATLASLGGTSSRRGSGDTSISADTEASIREIKDSLAEVEEKYKKAMVSNAQLDNEKTNFMYQVDTLKDALLELEEQLAESRRQYEEKSKEFEREKHAHSILQFQFMEIKEALKQREEMLAEIQQLQQKQQSYVREISDLQETIEWKDKKIGALERQKDFFDSIRSERDDLRDEVLVLKEQLKKHGIIPDSDVATNGDTSDILDNEGHLDSSRTAPGTTQALKTGGEGMLGKANEVEMKNEILEDVGKREILQNTEHEEHKEESEEEVQTLHAAENAKAEQMVEERDTLPAVMLPESRFAEQAQSLPETVSGSTSSNSDSDTDGLRKVTESRGTAAQQPESAEAEHHDLSARTNENLELGSLQGHLIFETPQEMFCDSGTEQELGEAAPNQEEQEDLETSHALSDDEMDEGSDSTSEGSELVSNQAGLPEGAVAGLLREEGNVESSTPEEPQHSEESAENKVANVLEEKFVDCTDGRSDKTAGDRAEEEDEVGNTVQGQLRETESVGLEGTEPCERDVPAEPLGKEGGEHQALIQPDSSEDSASASPEEPGTQGKTEDEAATAEKDGQKEELMEELEKCSGSAGKGEQGVVSVEAGGSIPEGKGGELQQAQPGTEVGREVITQETHSVPSLLDDEIKESELETGDEAGEGQGSRTEWVKDLNPKAEVQTSQGSEETAEGTEGEKNVPLEGEMQEVVQQVEGESEEESGVGVIVTTGNKASEETLKENEQEVELADHPGGESASEEGANNALEQKLVQDKNISEQVKLEEGANNSLPQKPVQDEDSGEQVKLEEGANNSLAQKLVQDEKISEQVKLEEGANNSLAQKLVQDENINEQVKSEEGANNSLEEKPVQDENIGEQVKLEEDANNSLAQKHVQDEKISEQVKLEEGANNSLPQKAVQDEEINEQVKLEEGANNSLEQKAVQDEEINEQVKLEEGANNSLPQKAVQDEKISEQVKLEGSANNSLEQKPVQDENISEQVKLEEGANNSLEEKPVQDENIGEQVKLEEDANNSLPQKLVQDENINEQVKSEEGANNSLEEKPVQDENIGEQVKLEEDANNSLPQKAVQDEKISEQVKLEEGANNSLPQKAVQDEEINEQVKLEEDANNSLEQKAVQDEEINEQVKLEEGANNSLPQKAVQDDISEQVKLEDQAEESLEDDGDAFDFDEESNQILESDEKCDEEKGDAHAEEGHGANGAVGKTAHTDKAGEGRDKMETKDVLTKVEVLQHKKDEPEETGCLQGQALGKADEEADEIKVSDSSRVGKFQDRDVLEQDLERAFIKRAESREDLQVGKRSKGRSREDCTIS
ncbi:leucine-rich repeat flightless-interacting protein 1 isoform X7 [Agelaius tricolor]|uniref:leucine-rich repeat flightless-interacting protein 1 isoform X7 n=1 Tax=Agelaius tricolor TaxID=9191 RepID=UPI0039F1FBEC